MSWESERRSWIIGSESQGSTGEGPASPGPKHEWDAGHRAEHLPARTAPASSSHPITALSTNHATFPSSPLSFCFLALSSEAQTIEAQTIEADDPTTESTASPPPAATDHLLWIGSLVGPRLPDSGLFSPSHFLLEMRPLSAPYSSPRLRPLSGGSRTSLFLRPSVGHS